jgi:DNA-binding NtrC family response regulator
MDAPRPRKPELLIGESPAMQRLRRQIARFGPTELPVLIFGESGTGKELVARALHDASGRRGELIAVNCGALPRELIESELFGHERGAFTGAQRRHLGCFGEADCGTLFLDEIGELPLELQPRLLRALENRAIRPVGAAREQPVDVRVLAATHRDLEQAVREGRFRADLYYRLCALEIAIPPLRERVEDIPLLIRHFLVELPGKLGPSGRRFTLHDDELPPLLAHPWPGNVRQLRHALLRAVHLCGPELRAEDLLGTPRTTSSGAPLFGPLLGRSFAELERQIFLQALADTSGNCRAAAELLRMPKSTLHDRLRRLGILAKDERRDERRFERHPAGAAPVQSL